MGKIIITGSSGQVGKKLYKKLVEMGYEVIGVDIKPSTSTTYLLDLTKSSLLHFVNKNDTIIHLGGILPQMTRQKDYYRHNHLSSKKIMDSIKEIEIKKFIYLSTSGLYTDKRDSNYREEDICNTKIHPYVDSKYLGEKEVETFDKHLILRCPPIISLEDKFLKDKFIKLNKTIGIPLVAKGENVFSICYLDDLVDILIDSISNEKIGIYNIKSKDVSYRQLVVEVLGNNIKFINIPKFLLKSLAFIMDYIQKLTKYTFDLNSFVIYNLMYNQILDTKKWKEKR